MYHKINFDKAYAGCELALHFIYHISYPTLFFSFHGPSAAHAQTELGAVSGRLGVCVHQRTGVHSHVMQGLCPVFLFGARSAPILRRIAHGYCVPHTAKLLQYHPLNQKRALHSLRPHLNPHPGSHLLYSCSRLYPTRVGRVYRRPSPRGRGRFTPCRRILGARRAMESRARTRLSKGLYVTSSTRAYDAWPPHPSSIVRFSTPIVYFIHCISTSLLAVP